MTASSSSPSRIAVVIRVYSRITDAEGLVRIIRSNWTRNIYEILVVHNGEQDGHHATPFLRNAGRYIPVATNTGHRTGARDLVEAGLGVVMRDPSFSAYVFIEADCWLLDDRLVDESLHAMQAHGKHVCSSIWVERVRSMAVDFFILDAAFAKAHPDLLAWDDHPERHFSRRCREAAFLMDAMRPTHVPSLMRHLPIPPIVASNGRFRIFPAAPALTHHLEEMGTPTPAEALAIKQGLANALTGRTIFPGVPNIPKPGTAILQRLARYCPQSAWVRPPRPDPTSG